MSTLSEPRDERFVALFPNAARVETFSDPAPVPPPPPPPPPAVDEVVAEDGSPEAPVVDDVVVAPVNADPSMAPEPAADHDLATDGLLGAPSPAPTAAGLMPLVEVSSPRAVAAFLAGATQAAPAVASWGARGAIARVTGGLVKPAPSSAEAAFLADEHTIRTFTHPGLSFNVLVANKKGGVGKSPTSLLLGGVMARLRGGGVLVTEATEAAGGLARRAQGANGRGLVDLLFGIGEVRTLGQLDFYCQQQVSTARVLGSVGERDELLGGHYRAVRALVDQYFPLTVTDTANSPHADVFGAAVEMADVLVCPTTSAADSASDLVDTLSVIAAMGEHGRVLAARAVVVVTDDGRAVDAGTAGRVRELLDTLLAGTGGLRVAAVCQVPFDAHIAAGGPLGVEHLSDASRVAWTRVAATVLTAAGSSFPGAGHGARLIASPAGEAEAWRNN